MIITLDGPAASGKSSVALGLSRRLGFLCINSGAAYRVVTYMCVSNGKCESSREDMIEFLQESLPELVISWHTDEDGMIIHMNGQDVTSRLFGPNIDKHVSMVSAIPMVRSSINETLRQIGKENTNVCFEGRDMGSVVFTGADMKIFLTASIEKRALRRFEQIKNNTNITLDQIQSQMQLRDDLDSTRDLSPLTIPEGAFIFDNTDYSLEDTVDILFSRVSLVKEMP